MISAYQTCRICGAQVPSGFTNCDACYFNTSVSIVAKTGPLPFDYNLSKLKPFLIVKKAKGKKCS